MQVTCCLLTTFLFIVLVTQCSTYISQEASERPYRVVCVHIAWSFYRLGNGKFTVDNIDPHLCTHLVYGYAGIRNNRVRSLDGYLDLEGDSGKGNYRKFTDLRKENPSLKTLLSVGGRTEGSIKFSEMVQDPSKIRTFVQSCLDLVHKYEFDGINLDWQFPAHGGGVPDDKDNFLKLLQSLREEFSSRGWVLSASVSSEKSAIDLAYDLPKIASLVDFVNVMTYDYSRGEDKKTALNSPLFSGSQGDVDSSISYWLKQGFPADKLILGVSTYGQSWTLRNPRLGTQVGQNASGPGEPGPYTKEAGTLGYNEICESLNEAGWSVHWRQTERVPFATKDDQWVSFDDSRSVTQKSEYVVRNGLGGIMIHGIESDDGLGRCSDTKFPLLTAAYETLHGKVRPTIPTTTTTTVSPTTAPVTTSTKPTADFGCPHVGFFRNSLDCTRYYQCIRTGWNGRFTVIEFECGHGTVFDQKNNVCTWKQRVPECA